MAEVCLTGLLMLIKALIGLRQDFVKVEELAVLISYQKISA
jgi:hypothetical protein